MFAHLHSSPLVASSSLLESITDESQERSFHREGTNRSDIESIDIIDVKEERKLLIKCLQESKKRLIWHSEVADVHSFRKVLSYRCRALHFSGHGVFGNIIFENKKCEAHFVSQEELQSLLLVGEGDPQGIIVDSENRGSSLKLVLLSACHSESVASAFVVAGVPHVIVVSKEDKVLDKKAMEFSRAFYTALFAGHSVMTSFQIGQIQADIAIVSELGTSTFKLMGQGDHTVSLFGDILEGTFTDNLPPLPPNDCDAVAEVFIGRSLEIHQVYKSLVEGTRLISITGERGIGKTEIALQCADYATERRLYMHIFFMHLNVLIEADEQDLLVVELAKTFKLQIQPVDVLIDEIRTKLLEGKFLLVVDGCNKRVRNRIIEIISRLLRRIPSLSIILTSEVKMGTIDGVGEKVLVVDRLSLYQTAVLFTLRAPRKLKSHEMGGAADIVGLSKHPIIRSLGGHPRLTCIVAQFLDQKDMHEDMNEFLNDMIPWVSSLLYLDKESLQTAIATVRSNFEAKLLKFDVASTGPQEVEPILGNHQLDREGQSIWDLAVRFTNKQSYTIQEASMAALIPHIRAYFEVVMSDEAIKRPLSTRTIEFLSESREIWGGQSPKENGETVNLQMFVTFWSWFVALLRCVRATNIWGFKSPRLMHGFLSKDVSVKMLRGAPPGTFLIRFSETKSSTLVVVYVNQASLVKFVPIIFKQNLWCMSFFDTTRTAEFPSLQDLVLRVSSLKFLYPSYPKASVFSSSKFK